MALPELPRRIRVAGHEHVWNGQADALCDGKLPGFMAVTAGSPYSDEELVLLLDFFTRIREASLGAMTGLRDSSPKADRKRRGRGRR
jgi:hypothetical protein